MVKKRKNHLKIYDKYMNTSSSFEKDMFSDFKKMYDEKFKDPNFNDDAVNEERCKLILRIDSRVDGSLAMYSSTFISAVIFFISIVISKYINNPGVITIAASIALLIIVIGTITSIILMKNAIDSDVWNAALIALEAAYKENH